VGPGTPIPFLDRHETIKAVVDLQPRFDIRKIKSFTKDGIPLEVEIQIEFQIRASEQAQQHSSKLIYPFDPEEVKKSVERTAVKFDMTKKEHYEAGLVESVWGRIQGVISSYLFSHRLDELFADANGKTHLESAQVNRLLMEKANINLEMDGVFIKTMRFIKIFAPSDVDEKLKDYWKAQKKRDNLAVQGEIEVNMLEKTEKAHAEASRDVLGVIARSLQRIGTANFMQPLLYSLSEFLNQNLDDPVVRTYIGSATLEALEKIRSLIRQRF
jgi:hypothetical protein